MTVFFCIHFLYELVLVVVVIQMKTNCSPLVADLFLFCYERVFMMSLFDDKQADIIDAFNTTLRYLGGISNINNNNNNNNNCQYSKSNIHCRALTQ